MTKRFKVIDDMISPQFDKIETYTLSALVDTETKNFYFIVDDTANVQSFCDRLNNLNKENEQLKQQLQRMYDVATLNKAIEVLEDKYDKMLSDGSDEVKDAMRHTVLKCIEDLDELKDDITAR